MENDIHQLNFGKTMFNWEIPEYEKLVRTKKWYTVAIIVTFLLLLFSFFSTNFLFAVIIIIATLITIMHEGREPQKIRIFLTEEGVIIGKKFYDFDEIKDFSIIYKPRDDIKNLYFEFKNKLKQRLSIPLKDNNPLLIRKNLLKYLPEDLERTNQPLSEGLARLFKL